MTAGQAKRLIFPEQHPIRPPVSLLPVFSPVAITLCHGYQIEHYYLGHFVVDQNYINE
jgi:hypothetical protein